MACVCVLGLGVFGAGCGSDDPPSNSNGAAGANPAGGSGGAGGDGAGGTNPAAGSGGVAGTNPAGGSGGVSGAGVTGGVGGGGGSGGDGGTGATNDGKTWSHLGYDQTNTYFNPYETTISVETAPMLVKKWEFPTGAVPHGGVSIAEGKVFATSTAGVYALDLQTGTQVWHNADITSEGTAAYDAGFVYVHSISGFLHKLSAADGMQVWMSEKTYSLDGCDGTSSPVVGGGKVIVGHSCGVREVGLNAAMSLGGVEAFDAATGVRAWSYSTIEGNEDGAMVWSTVAIDVEAGVVYASTGNNYTLVGANSDAIHAIDLGNGQRVWRTQVREGDQWSLFTGGSADTDFGANPILAEIDGRKVVAAGDKGAAFWVLDRMTGEQIWDKQMLSATHTPANGGVLNNGAYDGQRFYVMSNDPTGRSVVLHALNKADGTAAWTAKTLPKLVWGMQSVANGVLAAPINNELHLYNAATGDMLNMFVVDGTIAAGAPAIADGMIVVKSGMQYAFAGASAIPATKIYAFGLP